MFSPSAPGPHSNATHYAAGAEFPLPDDLALLIRIKAPNHTRFLADNDNLLTAAKRAADIGELPKS